MKALSVRQPWASLIASGHKTIELRTWNTKFRGEFVLCSSASAPSTHNRKVYPEHSAGPRGVTLAIVELIDVDGADPYNTDDAIGACCTPDYGDFVWRVRVVRLLEPEPVKGLLGFWNYEGPLTFARTARKIAR